MNKEKLSNLYDIGSSKRVFKSEWREKGVPFYRAREIARLSEDGYVDNELFIDEDLYEEYTEKYGRPQPGDVMVTGVGTLGVCYVVKPRDKFYFKDGNILWFKQKAPDRIMPEYLVKAFESKEVKDFISKNSSGTTVGTFTIQTANRMEITLPSIDQQEQIIERISKLESIIKKRQNELVKLDELIKARFVEMFGDPVSNPKLWKMVELGSLTEVGSSKRIFEKEYVPEGIPFYRTKEIVELSKGNQISTELFITRERFDEIKRQYGVPKAGDLLISAVGTIGVIWIVDGKNDFYFKDGNLIRVDASDKFNSVFMKSVLENLISEYKNQMSSGTAYAALTISGLTKMKVYDVPMDFQKDFADFVSQVDKSKAQVQKALDETQLLFDSLMQEYFG